MKSIVRNENEDLSTKEVSIEEKKLWVSILTQTHGANLWELHGLPADFIKRCISKQGLRQVGKKLGINIPLKLIFKYATISIV